MDNTNIKFPLKKRTGIEQMKSNNLGYMGLRVTEVLDLKFLLMTLLIC